MPAMIKAGVAFLLCAILALAEIAWPPRYTNKPSAEMPVVLKVTPAVAIGKNYIWRGTNGRN